MGAIHKGQQNLTAPTGKARIHDASGVLCGEHHKRPGEIYAALRSFLAPNRPARPARITRPPIGNAGTAGALGAEAPGALGGEASGALGAEASATQSPAYGEGADQSPVFIGSPFVVAATSPAKS